MTLKNIFKDGAKLFSCIKKEISLSELHGSIIGIDALIYIYHAINKNIDPVTYFHILMYRLIVNGITPIVVFDGIPNSKKRNEIAIRRNKKSLIVNRPRLSYLKIMELKQALISWKIQTETIDKFDAESFISYLNRKQFINYVASEDSDVMAYGAKKWIRGIDTMHPQLIDIDKFKDTIDKMFNINCPNFINGPRIDNSNNSFTNWVKFLLFCILLGTDYNMRIMRFNRILELFRDRDIQDIINDPVIITNMNIIVNSFKIFSHSFPEYDKRYSTLIAYS